MRRISLTEEERQELELLHKTSNSALVRERSFMLLLSDSGQSINQIALTMSRSRRTVSDLLTLWEHRGSTAAINLLGMAIRLFDFDSYNAVYSHLQGKRLPD
jgi:hypothetical protein